MSLSCECDIDGDYAWYYFGPPQELIRLSTKRTRKCCSCGGKLSLGDEVGAFERYRDPANDIEERIYGDQVPLATWYACEKCWGLFWAVTDLGMCFSIGEDIAQQIKDYRRESA